MKPKPPYSLGLRNFALWSSKNDTSPMGLGRLDALRGNVDIALRAFALCGLYHMNQNAQEGRNPPRIMHGGFLKQSTAPNTPNC